MSSRRIFSMSEGDKNIELYGKESGDLEIHIDGAWGFTYVGGACKINLYTVAPTSEENYERRDVVARITMLPPVLYAMRDYLDQQFKRLEERGIVASPEELAKEAAEKVSTPEAAEALPSPEKSEN